MKEQLLMQITVSRGTGSKTLQTSIAITQELNSLLGTKKKKKSFKAELTGLKENRIQTLVK